MCLLFSRHWDDISRDSCNRLLPGKNLWTVNKTLVRPGCWIPALVSVSRQRTNVPDQLQRRTQRRMDSCKPIVDVSSQFDLILLFHRHFSQDSAFVPIFRLLEFWIIVCCLWKSSYQLSGSYILFHLQLDFSFY